MTSNEPDCFRPPQPPTRHRFSDVSGWCVNGCGTRDDGRIVNRSGSELRKARTEEPTEQLFTLGDE